MKQIKFMMKLRDKGKRLIVQNVSALAQVSINVILQSF